MCFAPWTVRSGARDGAHLSSVLSGGSPAILLAGAAGVLAVPTPWFLLDEAVSSSGVGQLDLMRVLVLVVAVVVVVVVALVLCFVFGVSVSVLLCWCCCCSWHWC